MKPIGQTFSIIEPPQPTGAVGVFVTQIDVFFQSVSSRYGIELQIRTTENGYPTSNRLPFARKILLPTDVDSNGVSIIRSSQNATIATPFVFDTPVLLQSNKTYAFVLIPLGGNPDYNVWTAAVGGNDVTTNTPIYTNNDSGDLFLSSNDIAWDPVINEDIKYTIYVAKFTTNSGTAYFRPPEEDWIMYKNATGKFMVRETVMFGNNYSNVAVLTVAGVQGTFNVNDTVYQSNGTANVVGKVYSSNSSVIKIANTTGAFAVTSGGVPLLFNANSTSNASVSTVSQSLSVVTGSNTVSLPDSSIFAVNNVIFVQTNNRSITQVVRVTSKPSKTTITVNPSINFTDTNALYGRVMYDGALSGGFSGNAEYHDTQYAVLDAVTSNTTMNLHGVSSVPMFGLISGTSATLIGAHDPAFNSITTNFTSYTPSNTEMNWSFRGFQNDSNYTQDGQFISIIDGAVNELTDYERVAMSRSNELSGLPPARAGNNSVLIKIDMTSQNTYVSPYVDTIQNNITYTYNIVSNENNLSGAYLAVANISGNVVVGDTITSTAFGNVVAARVASANSSYIRVTNINGVFQQNTTFTTSLGGSGTIVVPERYNEANTNGFYQCSRHISKTIVLGDGQDSEDILVKLSAYRPANTNVNVYARLLNGADNQPFNQKSWSKLNQTSLPTLLSSRVNIDDIVELTYGFNQSSVLFSNGVSCNTTNNVVSVPSTLGLSNNTFIYLQSNTSTSSSFNVREVVYVVNSTAVVIDRPTSMVVTNGVIGVIPGIESTTSAFLYDLNSNIVRYSTYGDVVYDGYKQYALKIVPTADSTSLVPRVGDVQVLNLQV